MADQKLDPRFAAGLVAGYALAQAEQINAEGLCRESTVNELWSELLAAALPELRK